MTLIKQMIVKSIFMIIFKLLSIIRRDYSRFSFLVSLNPSHCIFQGKGKRNETLPLHESAWERKIEYYPFTSAPSWSLHQTLPDTDLAGTSGAIHFNHSGVDYLVMVHHHDSSTCTQDTIIYAFNSDTEEFEVHQKLSISYCAIDALVFKVKRKISVMQMGHGKYLTSFKYTICFYCTIICWYPIRYWCIQQVMNDQQQR